MGSAAQRESINTACESLIASKLGIQIFEAMLGVHATRLRGRMTTYASKKGSEKVLRRVLRRVLAMDFAVKEDSEKGKQRENSKCYYRLGKAAWTPCLQRLGFSTIERPRRDILLGQDAYLQMQAVLLLYRVVGLNTHLVCQC